MQNAIYCVREDHSNCSPNGDQYPVNTLVSISPAEAAIVKVRVGTIIHVFVGRRRRSIGVHISKGDNDRNRCKLLRGSSRQSERSMASVDAMGTSEHGAARAGCVRNAYLCVQPWDATEIWVSSADGSGARCVLGDGHTNYMQPQWAVDDRLFVVADVTDWWNVYEVDFANGAQLLCEHCVTNKSTQANY
jgi:hypothetical protein